MSVGPRIQVCPNLTRLVIITYHSYVAVSGGWGEDNFFSTINTVPNDSNSLLQYDIHNVLYYIVYDKMSSRLNLTHRIDYIGTQ